MFAIVHRMRTPTITIANFACEGIIAAILFQATMDRGAEKRPTAGCLWNVGRVVLFRKWARALPPRKMGPVDEAHANALRAGCEGACRNGANIEFRMGTIHWQVGAHDRHENAWASAPLKEL